MTSTGIISKWLFYWGESQLFQYVLNFPTEVSLATEEPDYFPMTMLATSMNSLEVSYLGLIFHTNFDFIYLTSTH